MHAASFVVLAEVGGGGGGLGSAEEGLLIKISCRDFTRIF